MFAISWPNLSREWVEKYESWPWSSQFEPKGGHNEAKKSQSNDPIIRNIFLVVHRQGLYKSKEGPKILLQNNENLKQNIAEMS